MGTGHTEAVLMPDDLGEREYSAIMELLKLSKWAILACLLVGGYIGNEFLL